MPPVIQIYADITVLINIAYTEPHGERVFHLGRMQVLGNRIAHAVFSNQPYCFLSGGIADLSFDIQSRIFAGFFRLLGNIVHQIMDMKHISAGKNAGYTGFQAFIHVGAGGDGTHINTQLSGQFVFRDQSHRKQKRVTGDIFLCTRNGFPLFIHLSQGHALYSFLSVDIHHSSTELQGNAEIIQTLHDISLQAAGIGHQLRNHLDLRPFQGHTPGHDKADVTGTQDDEFLSRHKSVHIDKALGRSGGINARRTVARDIQRPSRPFPAAHGEDDGFGSERHQAVLPVHRVKARISVLTEKLCIPVGFHAHNNLGLAIANSLAAISEGASYIDGSLRGLGAGAGNAQIEVLQAVLQRQGCDSGADFEVLMETAEEEVAPIMRYPQVIDADSLMLGYAGVYSSFLLHAKRASERFGVNTRDILAELGMRKMVGGQEDMIVDVAYELAHNK